MHHEIIGWDIGGAHVKAARLNSEGVVLAIAQVACPLWRGIGELERSVSTVLAQLAAAQSCPHAITMTGELVDAFTQRRDGVRAIVAAMARLLDQAQLYIYAGPQGLLTAAQLGDAQLDAVASANWLVSAAYVATQLPDALFIDMGSTTTDILLISNGTAQYRGYSDFERLRQEELVYTGVVRTPVMAVAERAPYDGDMILLAAEHFATMADVYRLLNQLPEHADQWPTADGGEKSAEGSARRIARLLGRDLGKEGVEPWRQVATYLSECQMERLHLACLRQLSRGLLDDAAPLMGAGVGRFVLTALAQRLNRPYTDISDFMPVAELTGEIQEALVIPRRRGGFQAGDLVPAVAVAQLAIRTHW